MAAAYGFAVHAVILVPATILGLYYLWSMKLSLSGIRRSAPVYEPVPTDD